MCAVLASLNCPDEVDSSLVCSLPEGFSPATTDSENLEGVWPESSSSVDVSNMQGSVGLHKVISAPGKMESVGNEFSKEMSLIGSGDILLQDKELVEKSDATLQPNVPTSPLRSSFKNKELPEEFAGVGAGSLSNLYSKNVYSHPGSTQSSIAGSPPRAIPSTPMIVSLTGHLYVSGAARLSLPHGVNNTAISVHDDEPTSIIAYALLTPKYHVSECSAMYYHSVLAADCFSAYRTTLFILAAMSCNFKCSPFINVYQISYIE